MPDNAKKRFGQLTPETMEDRQKQVAERISKFTVHGIGGPFNIMLRSPEAADAMISLGEYLRFDTGIDDRLVELAILIHARTWTDQYEWARHVDRARDAGVTDAIIDDLRQGKRPASMQEDETAVFDFCVALALHHQTDEAAYRRIEAMFGQKGAVDMAIMLGNYCIVSFLLNLGQVGLPEGGDEMPALAAPFADA